MIYYADKLIFSRFKARQRELPELPQGGYSDIFHFRDGAMFAFDYALQQFRELMDEWYGNEDYQDEKEEMTRLFERRIGIEE